MCLQCPSSPTKNRKLVKSFACKKVSFRSSFAFHSSVAFSCETIFTVVSRKSFFYFDLFRRSAGHTKAGEQNAQLLPEIWMECSNSELSNAENFNKNEFRQSLHSTLLWASNPTHKINIHRFIALLTVARRIIEWRWPATCERSVFCVPFADFSA